MTLKKRIEGGAMLQSLHIVNFALLADTEIDFSEGVTVFTGETGSGKSILIDALAVLTGRRARVDLIRTGASFFLIEGIFKVDKEINDYLAALGFDTDGTQVILSRKLTSAGRGTCRINGSFCTVKQLNEIGGKLVRLHEQNDNLELLSSGFCREILDGFSHRVRHAKEIHDAAYEEWKKAADRLEEFEKDKQERARKIDILTWELEQIQSANVTLGEDEILAKRLKQLENHERIVQSLQNASSLFGKDGGIRDLLAQAGGEIAAASKYDDSLSTFAETTDSASYMVDDVLHELETYLADVEFSSEELAQCQGREETLNSLKRKFGPELPDVIAYGKQAEERLHALEKADLDNKDLKERLASLEAQAMDTASALNETREEEGKTLIHEILDRLHFMGMDKVRMELRMVPSQEPTLHGIDTMEFYFSANPGEPMRPMRETASGGEVSRIALAIEIVRSSLFKQQTLVFDEIDVGISGKTGLQIARLFTALAKRAQLACVTHLPQTACAADRHYQIIKAEEAGQTISRAKELDEKERIQAIAQMISGQANSASAMNAAEEMRQLVKRQEC